MRMSNEKCKDKMTYVRVSCGNVERIKAIGKKGETLDDVVTMLLDFYVDLRRQDWTTTKSDENKNKELTID
jgi:hypothetical protein